MSDKTTTPKHTPTPWNHAGNGCTTALHIYASSDRERGGTGCVATLHAVQDDILANAALIVRAVNAYEPMRAVVEQIAWRYEQEQRDGMSDHPGAISHYLGQAARAALALAEEGAP